MTYPTQIAVAQDRADSVGADRRIIERKLDRLALFGGYRIEDDSYRTAVFTGSFARSECREQVCINLNLLIGLFVLHMENIRLTRDNILDGSRSE